MPGFQIKGNNEIIRVKSDTDYWIDLINIPDALTKIRWQNSKHVIINLEQLNHKTLKLKINGKSGSKSHFYISNSKKFIAIIE